MLVKLMEVKAMTNKEVKRPKLSFEELLAKYEKIGEANVTNQPLIKDD